MSAVKVVLNEYFSLFRYYLSLRKLLDDLKDKIGYAHLKEKALDRTMRRNRFGKGVGPVVRQNTE